MSAVLFGDPPPTPVRETERTMLDRLNARYGKTYRNGSYVGREFARAEHVPDGMSWDRRRIADFMAVRFFRSVGDEHLPYDKRRAIRAAQPTWSKPTTTLIGHEVKVSRSDWLAELRDPDKAESWKRYCHEWYLVVSDADIVHDGELPDGWGLLVRHGKGLRIAHRAPRLNPEALSMDLVAALTRGVMQTETRLAPVGMTEGTDHAS